MKHGLWPVLFFISTPTLNRLTLVTACRGRSALDSVALLAEPWIRAGMRRWIGRR